MTIDAKSFDTVTKIVREKSAIVLGKGKEYLVEARLKPLCRQEGFDSIEALVTKLQSRPQDLVTLVVEALTTNETSFFRDTHPFDAMKETILPAAIERRRAERRLDIWCAASSSGQEPLSLGMLIRENFPELGDWKVSILCTDINEEMLERGRSGVYSQLEVSRGLPAKLLIKYFTKVGTRWKVQDDLLSMIEYKQMNLAATFPLMRPMDVIFLRNVMIYFDKETKAKILTSVHKTLRPDGTLFLGTAETPNGLCDGFNPRALEKVTCYQRVA